MDKMSEIVFEGRTCRAGGAVTLGTDGAIPLDATARDDRTAR